MGININTPKAICLYVHLKISNIFLLRAYDLSIHMPFLNMCFIFHLYVYEYIMSNMCVPGTQRDQKRVQNLWGLDLQKVEGYHVGGRELNSGPQQEQVFLITGLSFQVLTVFKVSSLKYS